VLLDAVVGKLPIRCWRLSPGQVTHPCRKDTIYNEAIVDARPEEQAMSRYYLILMR
jgi:hypothetical protein